MKILIISTGGTIDKDYPRRTGGYAFEFGEPAAKRLMDNVETNHELKYQTAFQKDSLDITTEDRHVLARLINESSDEAFIVTHGTDSMIETAKFLGQNCPGKLIVLTGSARPERFKNSDASFNLGSAFSAVGLLENGVWISMNGSVFPAKTVKRDPETGKFH
jgi:L-asparaginase